MPLKKFLKTSLPAAVDLASQTIMWTIEAIFIGRLGAAALAGHSMAIQIVLVFFAVLLTFVVGAGLIINRHLGARDFERANHILGQALMMAAALSVAFALIWHFGAVHLFRLISEGETSAARQAGTTYLRTISYFGPLIMCNFVATGIVRAIGETRFSMRINLLVNSLNIILSPILVFGLFGAPRLEVRGAALAVGCAHSIGFLLSWRLLRSGRSRLFLGYRELAAPRWEAMKELFSKGLPTTIEQMTWALGQLAVISYAGIFSVAVLSTHAIFMRIQNVLSMVYMGFGLAAMSEMGQNLGAAQHEAALSGAKTAHRAMMWFVGIVSLLLVLFAQTVIRIFTTDGAIVELGRKAVWLFAAAQVPKAINSVLAGNLRGIGELKWLMLITIAFVVSFEIGLNYVAIFALSWGLYGIWAVQMMDETVRLGLNFMKFTKGDWRRCLE